MAHDPSCRQRPAHGDARSQCMGRRPCVRWRWDDCSAALQPGLSAGASDEASQAGSGRDDSLSAISAHKGVGRALENPSGTIPTHLFPGGQQTTLSDESNNADDQCVQPRGKWRKRTGKPLPPLQHAPHGPLVDANGTGTAVLCRHSTARANLVV